MGRRLARELALVLLFGAAALTFAGRVLHDIDHWGIQDWDQHFFHHAAPRATVLEYGQIPLWNPYNGSGVPLLANPESRVLSPSFALVLVFGVVVGLKLEIVLFLVVGMLGAYHLLRGEGARAVPAITSGFAFMLGSWYALHLTVGQTWALNLAYLPWALLGYRKALEDLRYTLVASACLALMLFGGGAYPFMSSLLLFGCYSLAAVALTPRRLVAHARVLLAVCLQTAGLAAIKLLPMLALMLAHPRLTQPESGFTPRALIHALLDRDQTLLAAWAERPEEFHHTMMHEGMYVGVAVLALAALGLLRLDRRRAPLLIAGVLFGWITLGSEVPISLWSAIHVLPGFDNMHMVQRFGIVVLLVIAFFAGLGLDGLQRRVERASGRPRLGLAVAVAAACLVFADLVAVGAPIFGDAFPIPPLRPLAHADFVQITRAPAYDENGWTTGRSHPLLSSFSGLYPAFLANRGSTHGYEVVPVPSRAASSADPGYRGEVYLVDASGEVAVREWSPNRLVLHVEADAPGSVIVNQNHAPGWRARGGHEVGQREGLLAVAVTPADREIELYYRPASFVAGAALSAASWGTLLALWLRGRRAAQRERVAPSGSPGPRSRRSRPSSSR